MINLSQRRYTAEGVNLERMIVLAAEKSVELLLVRRLGLRKMAFVANERDEETLLEIASSGGWRVERGGITGAARIVAALKRQRRLLILFVCACVILAVLSSFIWHVEVTGSALYQKDVLAWLYQNGMKPPFRRADTDTDSIEAQLMWRYPSVTWIECALRGVTLEVRMHEGMQHGRSLTIAGEGDVVASRGGIVEQVITTSGTAVVCPGQTVSAGDVLIRGEERLQNGASASVQANGVILARVWDGASASVALTLTETDYTGEKHAALTLMTPWFPLWETGDAPYQLYDTHASSMPLGGIFLPVWTFRTTAFEYTMHTSALNKTQAMASAADAAYAKLLAATGFDDDFVDKWVEYSMIEDEIVCAYAYGERIIDIAADALP